MGKSIHSGSRELYFFGHGDLRRFDDEASALQFVRELAEDPLALASLRELLVEQGSALDLAHLEHEDLLRELAALLADGHVQVARAPGVAYGGVSPEQWPDETTSEARENTWIEIQLVDEKNRPVSGERYRIVLPDGSQRTGTTDASGLARHVVKEPGECKIYFTELDSAAWEEA